MTWWEGLSGFADTGLGELKREELEGFSAAIEVGINPLEVGRKTLAGMSENRRPIFTHPEFAEDFREIYDDCMVAMPDE